MAAKSLVKDELTIYQFGRAAELPTVSPYSLKLETFVRLHNIPYKNVFVLMERSKHGLLPYADLNGETIADSQFIIEKVKEHFKIKEFDDPAVEGNNRGIQRMIENHSFFVLNYFKIIKSMNAMGEYFVKENNVHPLMVPFMKLYVRFKIGKKMKTRQLAALGDYTEDEFKLLLKLDLDALKGVLGDKQFFNGDTMTSTDCSVFGMLVPIVYLPIDNYAKRLLATDEYKNITDLLERIREKLWKDDFTTDKTKGR